MSAILKPFSFQVAAEDFAVGHTALGRLLPGSWTANNFQKNYWQMTYSYCEYVMCVLYISDL